MEKNGLIHENLDIKILILYILNRLPDPIDDSTLAELCQCDEGVRYFEYAECLADLVETGHVSSNNGLYAATEKGKRNGETIESSLPYTVRNKAEKALAPIAAAQRRRAMITAAHTPGESGGVNVSFGLSDGVSEILSVKLLVPDEETAQAMENRFRSEAEAMYDRIAQLLLGEV